MRRAPLRARRHRAPRVGVWTEHSEVPLARLHAVEARSNPPRGDGGNAPLRAPNAGALVKRTPVPPPRGPRPVRGMPSATCSPVELEAQLHLPRVVGGGGDQPEGR